MGRCPASPRNGLYCGGRNGGRTLWNKGDGFSDMDTFGGVDGTGCELILVVMLLPGALQAVLMLRRWLLCAGGGVVTFSFLS